MSERFQTTSPVDGSVYVDRPWATHAEIEATLARADAAAAAWRGRPLAERVALLAAMTDAVMAEAEGAAEELIWQIGRPSRYAAIELRGFEERARYMLGAAPEALADVGVGDKAGFDRFIRREPLGCVLVLAPWNYPYLTAVNAFLPALVAGNVVVLKHSDQTPLAAERLAAAARSAGLPEGVFQILHATHDDVARMIADDRVDFVAFTGSVEGGRAIQAAAAGRFIGVGLELGGKDPGYVRPDADLGFAVESLVDGAFFNSGQSCCGVERVYVHADVYDRFVDGFVGLTREYVLGNPTEQATTLGPVVRAANAARIRAQIDDALRAGARSLVDPAGFPAAGGAYMAPRVLVDVDHTMAFMRDETFGPAVGIMKVSGDDEAIALMNDSDFGLTASLWTADVDAATALGDRLETGTVFLNRCDYLDPALAWVGVKCSGRGCTLSSLGYAYLTRPKSFHFRTIIPS